MIITSSLNINEYNKNQIIASNLAREWLELAVNLRDSNYKTLHQWNSINPNLERNFNDLENKINTWSYYKIELDYSSIYPAFSVKLEKIQEFREWKAYLWTNMMDYELCLDNDWKYVHNCWQDNKKSNFYRYVKFNELKYKNRDWEVIIIPNSYKLVSKVIWYKRWYHEIIIETILTDYKKF